MEREKLVEALLKDYPSCDRLMVECAVDEYLHDPAAFDKHTMQGHQPVKRCTEYIQKGAVTVTE